MNSTYITIMLSFLINICYVHNQRTAFDKLRQRGAEDWVSLQQMLKKAPLPERVTVEGSIF